MIKLLAFLVFLVALALKMMLDYLNMSMQTEDMRVKRRYLSNQYFRLLGLTGVFLVLFIWEGPPNLVNGFLVIVLTVVFVVFDSYRQVSSDIGRRYLKVKRTILILLTKRLPAFMIPVLFVIVFFEDGPWLPYWWMGMLVLGMILLGYTALFRLIIPKLFSLVPYSMPFDTVLNDLRPGLKNRIYLMKSKRIRLPINALFTGFSRQGKVLLSAPLLSTLKSDHVRGIIAHEIGHAQKRHLWVRLVFLVIAISLYIGTAWVVYETALVSTMNLADSFISRIALFMMMLYIVELIVETVFYRLSQYQEYAADLFTVSCNLHAPLAEALFFINQHQKDPVMHPLSRRLQFSHPSVHDRIKRLKQASGEDDTRYPELILDIRPQRNQPLKPFRDTTVIGERQPDE